MHRFSIVLFYHKMFYYDPEYQKEHSEETLHSWLTQLPKLFFVCSGCRLHPIRSWRSHQNKTFQNIKIRDWIIRAGLGNFGDIGGVLCRVYCFRGPLPVESLRDNGSQAGYIGFYWRESAARCGGYRVADPVSSAPDGAWRGKAAIPSTFKKQWIPTVKVSQSTKIFLSIFNSP